MKKERNTKINIFRSAREDFFRRAIGDQYATVALSLISKELIERINLTFPRDINNGEDYFFTCTCLLHTKNACCVNHYLYYYNRLNQLSTMANQDEKRILEQIIASKLVEKELKRSGYINKYKKEILVRKYNSKRPLLKINPLKFFPIFPESNVLYLYYIGNLTKGVLKRKL